jgi:hypothetical protein
MATESIALVALSTRRKSTPARANREISWEPIF